jgi:hypothetical protein
LGKVLGFPLLNSQALLREENSSPFVSISTCDIFNPGSKLAGMVSAQSAEIHPALVQQAIEERDCAVPPEAARQKIAY